MNGLFRMMSVAVVRQKTVILYVPFELTSEPCGAPAISFSPASMALSDAGGPPTYSDPRGMMFKSDLIAVDS